MSVSKIYLDNYLCRNEYEFKREFEKHFHFQESKNGTLWRMVNRFPLAIDPVGLVFRDAVWIHVWDDSPFSSDLIFELCLKNCNQEKNFFVWYENGNSDFFKEHAERKFGTCYPDINKRNEHVFLINPNTNAGMDKLVEALRKAQLC